MDTEIAELLRDDRMPTRNARPSRTTAEVCNTVQRPEIQVGVMGYPEKASAEIGRLNFEDPSTDGAF